VQPVKPEPVQEEPEWKTPHVQVLSSDQSESRLKLKPVAPIHIEVPAKQQVSLKITKPKPAGAPAPELHVTLTKPVSTTGKIPEIVQPSNLEQQKSPPVVLKPAFKPKLVAGEQVQLSMEKVQLKDTPLMQKNLTEKTVEKSIVVTQVCF